MINISAIKNLKAKKQFIVISLVLVVLVGFLVAFTAHTLKTERALAASNGANFNPGRIIDDSTFYNAGSMSTPAIQSFLNERVPICDTYGTSPSGYGNTRAQYAASRGWQAPPYTCLRGYSQNTPQMEAASRYCNAISARTSSSGAQIIYDVANACGINPQVLIVLLEKEQSLITDTWPLDSQFKNATGFACPDTAPCDPAYAGFFYQVYHAARQFKVYQLNQTSYNYVAGRNNRIYWQTNLGNFVNPSGNVGDANRVDALNRGLTGCGYSDVFIQNQATAALYAYTPYQPNQSALGNIYGLGDGCSAYGNRNFWRIFSDWFGSPTGASPSNLLLPNGAYEFVNLGSYRAIDVAGGSTASGAGIQIYDRNHSSAQRWQLVRDNDGYYSVISSASGKYLDVAGGSQSNGARLQLWDGNGSCAQKWSITSFYQGAVLLNKCSGLSVDIMGGNMNNGTSLQTWAANGSVSQAWMPVAVDAPPVAEGFYTINSASNLALDIKDASTSYGARVQLWNPNSSDAQYWQFNRLENGFYTIRNPISHTFLDVANASQVPGTYVQIWGSTGSCAQQWAIAKNSDNSFSIRSACSDLVLDIQDGATSLAGANIQIYTANGSAAQKWSLTALPNNIIPIGTYSLKTKRGTVLDISGGSTANSTPLQIYTANGSAAQQWQLLKQADSSSFIYNPSSGKYIDIRGGNLTVGSTAQIYTGNGSCAQKWHPVRNTNDGTYTLASACSSQLALDVNGGEIGTLGANLQLYNRNGSGAQSWVFGTP
ncbi:MAG: RICIN domain-containing protein [Patescibacteria group bacterium]